MREIVIISGKGGTGKTTVTSAFASLAKNKVMADCDVDAADLHLILKPDIKHREDFRSGKKAYIRQQDCIDCGKCIEVCQFDAISDDYVVDPISCEGCGVCVYFCPVDAIDFNEVVSGEWFISETRFGPLVHAKLGIAEENSGKLVSLVRRQAKLLAEEKKLDYIIVDGSPGVGCPVISSITGADAVLIVTEPTLSGVHDLERVVNLSKGHFGINTYVCVNKYDLNEEITNEIEKFCNENDVTFAGKIPYDTEVTAAMVEEKNVIEYSDGRVAESVRSIWERLK
ncbi:(4Fe-4S)-binding protein [candidate division KSB1 bacterium 4484_87]|nr:MAG: (4Fe-4S)-binding protein [candidate division KSB1 bacterium 4484_87]